MRIGFISDIHGNFSALSKVYHELAPISDRIICLGDIVAGRGENDLCIELLRENKIICVLGNMDLSCITYKKIFIEKEENFNFLFNLPETLEFKGIFAVHDNPVAVKRFYSCWELSIVKLDEGLGSGKKAVPFLGEKKYLCKHRWNCCLFNALPH